MSIDIGDLTEEKIIDMIEPHMAAMYQAGFEAAATQLHDGPLRAGDRVKHDKFPSCTDGVVMDFVTAHGADLVVVYWRDSDMRVAHHPAVRLIRIAGL